jgi:hypothetical protein
MYNLNKRHLANRLRPITRHEWYSAMVKNIHFTGLKFRNSQHGVVLIAALLMTTALITIGIALASSVATRNHSAVEGIYSNNALLSAEAGVEQSVEQLNQSDSFGGYTTDQTFFNNAIQGMGTFKTTVTASPDGSNAKIITAVGNVYRHGIVKAVEKRTIKVTVVGTSSQGYSVQTGPGGLILGGSANITNSQVYVNGTITLQGASKIGTASNPLNVYVANDACPTGSSPGATYPTVCTGSTQPISMAQSTAIYGTVCATGQTSTGPNNNIKTGSGGQGLVPGCTAPPVSQPTYDRAGQISAVTTTKPSTDSSIDCSTWQNPIGFVRTWPANLKITGNVSIASSCDLTITGNVYITGNLSIGGAAKLRVANSVGTVRPVIIVDGTIDTGGSASFITNASGTGVEFISFKSSASCSPSCTTLTGNNLKTSQALQTVTVGGAANMAGMIFDAYWGKISVAGSGNVGAAIGQTVDLSGAGTVTFGTTLSSGVRTWTITSYQQVTNSG